MLTWRVFILHDPCHYLLLRTPPFLDDTVGKVVTKEEEEKKEQQSISGITC
jgi:hypothetical protein